MPARRTRRPGNGGSTGPACRGSSGAARRTGRHGCGRRSPGPPARGPSSTTQDPGQGRSTGSGTTPPAAPAPAGWRRHRAQNSPKSSIRKGEARHNDAPGMTLARIPAIGRARQGRLVLPPRLSQPPASPGQGADQPNTPPRPATPSPGRAPRPHRTGPSPPPSPHPTPPAGPATDSPTASGTVMSTPARTATCSRNTRTGPSRPPVAAASPAPSPPAPATAARPAGDQPRRREPAPPRRSPRRRTPAAAAPSPAAAHA